MDSSPLALAVASALAPLVTFLKTGVLAKLAESGVEFVGGKIAGAAWHKARKQFFERMAEGKLPANHDVAKASRAALGKALQWMAHELGGQAPKELRGEILRRLDGGELADRIELLALPPEYTAWVKALLKLARDDSKLQRLDLHQIRGTEVARLLQTDSDADVAKALHGGVLAWLRTDLADAGEEPDRLTEFLEEGWPIGSGRLTLHQAWCVFFRESIKDQPKVFNSFVSEALADLLQRQDPAPLVEALAKASREQFDELKGMMAHVLEDTTSQFTWPRPMNFDAYAADHLNGFTGRAWLTDRVMAWLRLPAKQARQAMLIQAPFGVGKTAFMAHLARALADKQIHCATHFCCFDEQDTLQPGRIVRSLAAQFMAALPAYGVAVENDREARIALMAAASDPASAWTRAVVQPLVELSLPDHAEPLVLLIDGLDESQELHNAGLANEESLLDMIVRGTASRLPLWIRIVISARDDLPQLEEQASRFERIHMLRDAESANRDDLLTLVRRQVAQGRVRQLIDGAGMDEGRFVGDLAELCDDKFLLAHYFFKDAETMSFDKDDLRAVLGLRRDISSMEAYYAWVFRKRLKRLLVDKSKAEAVLGLIAVALTPLPVRAIADVLRSLGVSEQEVKDVVAAFGGLLRRDEHRGITFDHLSIEQWLDRSSSNREGGDAPPAAGGFDIDRKEVMRLLQEHCSSMATKPVATLVQHQFERYLGRHGVEHLIDAGQVAAALNLLMRLPFDPNPSPRASARPMSSGPPRRMEVRVINAIHKALQEFDQALDRGEAPSDRALVELDVQNLHRLLRSRDYETGKYEPVLRALIQFKRVEVKDFKSRYAGDLGDDLVFRNDFGVAHAEAWYYSRGNERERLLSAIVAMAHADDADDREIAGYALKHICQKIDPQPWWRDIEATIRGLAARYAMAERAVDRMVGGEMLLALAIQDVPVRDWFAADPQADRFWRPYWPNLRMDVEALCAYTRRPPAVQVSPSEDDDLVATYAAACAQNELTTRLAAEFAKHPLFRQDFGPPNLWRLHWAVGSLKDQQCDKIALDESLDDLLQLVDHDEHRETVVAAIRRLMLHPSWDLTEAGASLAADLIKRKGREGGPWWLIDELLKSEHWRLRYGGVDAAYNAGGLDGYKKFRQALLAVGQQPQCRIRGICADDLRMWVKQSSPARRIEILSDDEIRELLRCWLRTADDIWLLEYLHLLFSELWSEDTAGGRMQQIVRELMPDTLSHYLTLDAERAFYLQDADAFLDAVEAKRRQEWQAVN